MSSLHISRYERYLPIVVFALIIISRIIAIVDGRDPGFDQAMLMANFPLESLHSYFQPLPLFEQATALGSVALLDLVSNVFGNEGLTRIHAIRIWAALAACLGYFILYHMLRQSFSIWEATLALTLIAAPNEALLFTTNPKNYVNAFLVSCLLMWVGQAYLKNPDGRRVAAFLGVTLLTSIFAFTAPFIVAATGGGMLVATLSRYPRQEWTSPQARRDLLRLTVLGLMAVICCLLFFLYFTRPITVLDQMAYANRYDAVFLTIASPFSDHNLYAGKNILRVFYLMVAPAYLNELIFSLGLLQYITIIHLICLLISLIGFLTLWGRSKFLAGGLSAGILTILVANTAHILPIASVRHFLFLTPFVVPCFALGVVRVVEFILARLNAQAFVPVVLSVIMLAICGAAVLRSGDLKNAEVSEHLARIDEFPAPLWIYYGAQPSVRTLRSDLILNPNAKVIGLLPHESTTSSWMLAARESQNRLTSEEYFKQTATALAGQEPVWLLFTHYLSETRVPNGLDRFIGIAEADGRVCQTQSAPGSLLALCAMPDDLPTNWQ
ncbi:hypothetical protein [Ruegeria meonggei]|uniref:Glycosyltransferase RgtA/B/C/D-like domain-containing protein n=1 Tax=Ruegeria meonggei TaxID=1446476 RepID=A0A1X7ACM1_9RHOB|nr:hypothetical protein [Ruegeria meonggei]SLN75809.1 hypothetical protein RUM8411_04264 [Ruegeria meonggei]